MRRLANLLAILSLAAGNAAAHPGHGALEGHFHGWGPEHAVLLAVFFAALFLAARK